MPSVDVNVYASGLNGEEPRMGVFATKAERGGNFARCVDVRICFDSRVDRADVLQAIDTFRQVLAAGHWPPAQTVE